MNTEIQWSEQEACFARETRVWLAVNHNTSVHSGKWIRCSKCMPRASELTSCQSNLSHAWGYERLQKSKDCFENVNILLWPSIWYTRTTILRYSSQLQIPKRCTLETFFGYCNTLALYLLCRLIWYINKKEISHTKIYDKMKEIMLKWVACELKNRNKKRNV